MSYYGSIYEFVDKELWARLRGVDKLLIATATGGTRSSQTSRILTVKLGLSTASAHSPVLRPVLEAQKILARAQRVPPVVSLSLGETNSMHSSDSLIAFSPRTLS